jgi:hypothetical protein
MGRTIRCLPTPRFPLARADRLPITSHSDANGNRIPENTSAGITGER